MFWFAVTGLDLIYSPMSNFPSPLQLGKEEKIVLPSSILRETKKPYEKNNPKKIKVFHHCAFHNASGPTVSSCKEH